MSDEFFFLFKKTVSLFLFPMPVLLAVSLTGVVLMWFTARQRSGKFCVTVGMLGIALLSFKPLPEYFLGELEGAYRPYGLNGQTPRGQDARVRFVVVLAGGHTYDPSMPITSQLSDSSVIRLVEGIRIYRSHPGSKLVVDGWGRVVPTARLLSQLAVELGVPREDIIVEPRPKDTKDEARLLKAIVGDAPFVLVTAASHMARAMAMFRKQGLHPLPAPTAHRVLEDREHRLGEFFPGGESIRKAETVVYEYMGWAWAKLRGQL